MRTTLFQFSVSSRNFSWREKIKKLNSEPWSKHRPKWSNMPGRPRKTKKKAPLSPSESSKRKLRTIAKETEEETIESYLADFDIQSKQLFQCLSLLFDQLS